MSIHRYGLTEMTIDFWPTLVYAQPPACRFRSVLRMFGVSTCTICTRSASCSSCGSSGWKSLPDSVAPVSFTRTFISPPDTSVTVARR